MAMGRLDYTIGAEFRRQQGLAGRNNSVGVFMSAPLPFFDRNQGEVARARSEVDQAARRAAALRAAIASEVREACDQRDTARSLLQRIEHDMLTDAREVRTITEYAYQRGEASLVELLDAQRAFNETVQSHVAAKAEYARSLYLIDAVSGKGDAR
jgi:cobalt-zinc-cadmium efflux system outer membrane protein